MGVDPGCYGALALLEDGRLVEVHDTPILKVARGKSDKAEVDGYALAALIGAAKPDVCIIEQVGGMTGQSPSASFNFGRAAGAPEYAAKALGVSVHLVPPGTWKRGVALRGGKDDARAMAMRLWPEHAGLFRRKMDDGRAEAALITEYWRRKNYADVQSPRSGEMGASTLGVFG